MPVELLLQMVCSPVTGFLGAATSLGIEAPVGVMPLPVPQIARPEMSSAFGFLIFLIFINGLLLALLFAASPRIRTDPGARAAAALSAAIGVALFFIAIPAPDLREPGFHLMVAAALSGYAIVMTYLMATAAQRLWVVGLFRSGRSLSESTRSLAAIDAAKRVRLLRAGAARDPTDPRLRRGLVDAHVELGEHFAAAYEAYAWVELSTRGKSHMLALYQLCQILAERCAQLEDAQPHLRRLIRLYPRSYFASYARRLVNHYEAYADHEI